MYSRRIAYRDSCYMNKQVYRILEIYIYIYIYTHTRTFFFLTKCLSPHHSSVAQKKINLFTATLTLQLLLMDGAPVSKLPQLQLLHMATQDPNQQQYRTPLMYCAIHSYHMQLWISKTPHAKYPFLLSIHPLLGLTLPPDTAIPLKIQ